jgi:preprotein translocase subunit SecG
MTAAIVIIHIIASLSLIGMILLHAGRGGGVSDMFGGGFAPQSLGGSTVVERNLDRLTVFIGVAFAITTMLLAWLLG